MIKQSKNEIAKERIDILITNALREVNDDDMLSNAQANIAKKIAMRLRLRLPYYIRQLYCKKCKQFISPGKNARIRIGRSNIKAVRISCLKCGHVYHKILTS
jgi:ribonuclease P protein subunit RPR2